MTLSRAADVPLRSMFDAAQFSVQWSPDLLFAVNQPLDIIWPAADPDLKRNESVVKFNMFDRLFTTFSFWHFMSHLQRHWKKSMGHSPISFWLWHDTGALSRTADVPLRSTFDAVQFAVQWSPDLLFMLNQPLDIIWPAADPDLKRNESDVNLICLTYYSRASLSDFSKSRHQDV